MKNDIEVIEQLRKKWEIKNRIQTILVSLAIPSVLIGLHLLLKHDIVSELQVKYLGALWGFLLCGRGIFNIALQKWSRHWLEIECIILEKEIIEKGGFYKLFFPLVYYKYMVEKQKYFSTKIKLGMRESSSEKKYRTMMDGFDKGAYTKCYVNPKIIKLQS